jgi:FdhD protein
MPRALSKHRARVWRLQAGALRERTDVLAGEEPLEVRALHRGARVWQAVTMRTPGHDFELAAGLLFAEGVVRSSAAIQQITYCADSEQQYNVVNVKLRVPPDTKQAEAFRVVSSACGVCGKASLDALETGGLQPLESSTVLEPDVLYGLPNKLRAAQGLFNATGGLHAAAAFTAHGELLCTREDVGRHNAVDKLIGWSLLNAVSLEDAVVLVSGRVAFEIAHKCVNARVPVLCAIGAPSSLAVDLAQRFNLTLVGFLRADSANVYSSPHRVAIDSSSGLHS